MAVPSVAPVPTMTMETPDAMIAYSIALVPRSSRRKRPMRPPAFALPNSNIASPSYAYQPSVPLQRRQTRVQTLVGSRHRIIAQTVLAHPPDSVRFSPLHERVLAPASTRPHQTMVVGIQV